MCDDNELGGSDASDPSDTGVVRHEWTGSDGPSVTIVEAVAAVAGRTPTDLPPLRTVIDPDALEALLDGKSSPITVSFGYADTHVSVDETGVIEIRLDGDPPPRGSD